MEKDEVLNGIIPALFAKKEYIKAEASLHEHLNYFPRHAVAHIRLGEVHVYNGRYADARLAFVYVKQLDTSRIKSMDQRIDWCTSALEAINNQQLPTDLSLYAGKYEELTVSVRDEKLVVRGNDNVETFLHPLGRFDFEASPRANYRIQFVVKENRPEELIVYFLNGEKRINKKQAASNK